MMVLCVVSDEEQDITSGFSRRHEAVLGIVQEYVRQVLLEKIIRESEQAALREQAASLLAASQPVAARPGPGGFLGSGRFGVHEQPASGMKAFHQQPPAEPDATGAPAAPTLLSSVSAGCMRNVFSI